jgi:formate dehydrogenase major subunit
VISFTLDRAKAMRFDSVAEADVIVIIGANPTDGHPVFASHMKRRLREGAKLIIIAEGSDADARAVDTRRAARAPVDEQCRV